MDISTVADLVSQLRKKVDMQNKESVELTFVYLLEGCGKTHAKMNDTIPHTRIDMEYQGMRNMPVHRYLYESECCSVPSFSIENYHIF